MTAPFRTYEFLSADGTEPRSLPDRLGEIANVKDSGATGDGVTDDLAAILAAYNKGQVVLTATADSVGNVITFAGGVPASVLANYMYAIDENDPNVFNPGSPTVLSTTATTVTIASIHGTVHAGDTVTFNLYARGLLYFPPGTYYISAPVDVGQRPDGAMAHLDIIGAGAGVSVITCNFADYAIKRVGGGTGSVDGGFTVEKLSIINTHVDGGGIRAGASVGVALRDLNITADKAIDTDDSDIGTFGYFGSTSVIIENCNFQSQNALRAYSWGVAMGAEGAIINCTFNGFETGIRNFGGQGGCGVVGCYFELNSYGIASGWGPDQATYSSNGTALHAQGCHFKNNGCGIVATGGDCFFRGIMIEASEGTISGNPQYGVLCPGGSGTPFSGIRITGQYQVAGFAVTGSTGGANCVIEGVSVSNTSSLGGVDWILPGAASIANKFTGCNVAPVYTMSELPVQFKNYTVNTATWSAGVATITVILGVGDLPSGATFRVVISGVSQPGYDGTFIGSTVNFFTFTYPLASDPGGSGSGGAALAAIGSASEGDAFNVSDSNSSTWGANPSAGGSTHAKVRWGDGGTNWTVVGK